MDKEIRILNNGIFIIMIKEKMTEPGHISYKLMAKRQNICVKFKQLLKIQDQFM